MACLIPVKSGEDILPQWRGTPIRDLLAYHNLGQPYLTYARAEMVIAMCIDHRKVLRIPDNFAYVLRTGGGNPGRVEFEISFAIAVGGARTLAIIAHDDCGMVGLDGRRDTFARGLVEAGWSREEAEAHFDAHVPDMEIPDTLEFVKAEALRLQARYPKITIAPLFFSVKDGMLYQV